MKFHGSFFNNFSFSLPTADSLWMTLARVRARLSSTATSSPVTVSTMAPPSASDRESSTFSSVSRGATRRGSRVYHEFLCVSKGHSQLFLHQQLEQAVPSLVFVDTRDLAQELSASLNQGGFDTSAMGDEATPEEWQTLLRRYYYCVLYILILLVSICYTKFDSDPAMFSYHFHGIFTLFNEQLYFLIINRGLQ